MPAGLHQVARCRRWQPEARRVLVAMACMALASCGRGPGASHPDLTVASPAVRNDRRAAGAGFTFSATVHNAGRGNAAATTLRVYRSKDATVTASDKGVGAAAVTELPASESVDVTVELTAPSSAGTYYYGACVDAVDGESDTENNCSEAVPVIVSEPDAPAAPLPDLVLEPPEVSDAAPATGGEFTLSVRVRNAGSAPAAETAVRFYQSTDQAITPSDPEVGTDTIATLAASASHVASVDLTAPSLPGTYYYGACVSAADDQSDTANNCSASVRVTVPRPPPPAPPQIATRRSPGPDLEVEEDESHLGGSSLMVGYVRNSGDRRSPSTTVRFYRSTDSTITRSGWQVGKLDLNAIEPSQREYVGTNTETPYNPGTYYYSICVDVVAGETDTTNNCRITRQITVPPRPPPDVTVSIHSKGPYPASPAIGGRFDLPVIVKNSGRGAGWVPLRSYRSDSAEFTSPGTEVGVRTIDMPDGIGVSSTGMHLETPSSKGTYYYRVCADAVAEESDTSNNCSSPVKVEVSHSKPNLVIASLKRWVSQGKYVVMVVEVENVGSRIDEDERRLRFYRSTDATITTSDTLIGAVKESWTWPSSRFDFFTGFTSITIPDTPGTHYFGACVDVLAGELNTTDNCSWSLRFHR